MTEAVKVALRWLVAFWRRLDDATLRMAAGPTPCLERHSSGARCETFRHAPDIVHVSRGLMWDADGVVDLCGPDGRRATPEYAAWVERQGTGWHREPMDELVSTERGGR